MNLFLFALVLVAAAWSLRLFMSASVRRRSSELVDTAIDPSIAGHLGEDGGGRLAVWLSLAGFRGPSASTIFLAVTAAMIAVALAIIFLLYRFQAIDAMAEAVSAIPGGIGDALALV